MTYTIGRFLQVSLSFILSCVTAIIMLSILGGRELVSLYTENTTDIDPLLLQLAEYVGAFLFFITVSPALTILPALLAIIIGEVARIKSSIYYMLTGGLAVLAIPFLFETGEATTFTAPSVRFMTIFAATGFVSGFIYWVLAGRQA